MEELRKSSWVNSLFPVASSKHLLDVCLSQGKAASQGLREKGGWGMSAPLT